MNHEAGKIMIIQEKNHMGRRLAFSLLGLLCLMSWCAVLPAAAFETQLKKVSLIPHWSPQAQFAGYYVAMEKGIYRKHGMDMTVLKGGPGCSSLDYLENGRADFAVQWLTTAMQRHDRGLPLVHLAQVVPRSSMLLVAKKSSGIRKPSDMNGKKVGLWGGDFAIPPRAFFVKHNLTVKEVPQSYTVNLFLRGGVDVASAMWYNEYHTILGTGVDNDELTVFPLHTHGVNFPEDGLYMMEAAYKKNPGLAQAFVKASFEGWQYAFDHPEEALDIITAHMRKARIPSNRAHQRWMLSRMKDLVMPGKSGIPADTLNPENFKSVADFLLKERLIRQAPDYRTFTGGTHGNR